MRQSKSTSGERIVKDIKRQTRKQYSAEEKIRIVLDGLRGEESIAELCRQEGIAQGLYYKWSKDFLEAGKKRLAGDIVRQASSTEVTALKAEARDLKEVVAEQTLELVRRTFDSQDQMLILLTSKKACSAMGATRYEVSRRREA